MFNEQQVLNSRYRLEHKVGEGTFAQVFLATDLYLLRKVAIKILNAKFSITSEFMERFVKEAQAIAVLDHPNIIGVYDYGRVEDTAYLVMPFIAGQNLDSLVAKTRYFSLEQTCYFISQAASAIDYAHLRKVVHRDIKPQNMMVREEDKRLLLADFGLSKVLDSADQANRTALAGTPTYMAPEYFEGNLSLLVDVYALGCVAYKLLTGEVPFFAPTIRQIMYGHLYTPVPALLDASKGKIPQNLANLLQPVIEKALAKDPTQRYQGAGEFSRDLAQVFEKSRLLDEPKFDEVSPYLITLPAKSNQPFYQTPEAIKAENNVYNINKSDNSVLPLERQQSHLAVKEDQKAIQPKSHKFRLEVIEGLIQGYLELELTDETEILVTGIRVPGSRTLHFWKLGSGEEKGKFEAKELSDIQFVSRNHAYFKVEKGLLTLFSGNPNGKAASNGTFINGVQIQQGTGVPLEDNDVIGLGPRARVPNHFYSRKGGVTLQFQRLK